MKPDYEESIENEDNIASDELLYMEEMEQERMERYHEIGREMNRLTEDAPKDPVVIPYPIHHTYWRQMMKGDFLDVIFDCPFEMHEFLTDADYSKIIYDLKDSYKELIYYLYIRDYSTLYVGNLIGQTDRNIRGVRSTILGQITKKVIAVLLERQEFDIPLWTTEKEFMEKHKEKIPDIQRKATD